MYSFVHLNSVYECSFLSFVISFYLTGPAVVDQLLRELSQKVQKLEDKYRAKLQGLKVKLH